MHPTCAPLIAFMIACASPLAVCAVPGAGTIGEALRTREIAAPTTEEGVARTVETECEGSAARRIGSGVTDFPAADRRRILSDVMPGDIMLQNSFAIGNGPVTALSKGLTASRYLHSAMVVGRDARGRPLVAESSTPGGLRIVLLDEYLKGRQDVRILRPDYAPGQRDKVADRARGLAGKNMGGEYGYDYLMCNADGKDYYCNEFVWKVLETAGVGTPEGLRGRVNPANATRLAPIYLGLALRPGGLAVGADAFESLPGVKVVYAGRLDLPRHPFAKSYLDDIVNGAFSVAGRMGEAARTFLNAFSPAR